MMQQVFSRIKRLAFISLLFLFVPTLLAHTYFVALTEISVNQRANRVEIVHHFTTHDLETRLSDKYQQNISADSKIFAQYLQQYIKQGFVINRNGKNLDSQWIGFENDVSETTIYQTIDNQTTLSGLEVTNRLLTEYFPKQVNRVVFSDNKLTGTLIFDKDHHSLSIK